jgi:pyruvate/2-oxoglutarate/acetoin dehydrogenase E1 component
MMAALQYDGPVIFLEHKLLSETYLDFLGSGGRRTVQFDVPAEGTHGSVPNQWEPLPIGKALLRREGNDVTMVSVGVGVHRALAAAHILEKEGINSSVLDLRTVSPLDKAALCETVARTGHLLVIDEDYESFGLSGELAAVVLEAGIPVKFARVCTRTTIPYARKLEDEALPNVERIRLAAISLLQNRITK